MLLSRTAAGNPVDIKGKSKYFCLVAQTCQITEKDILNFLITSRRQRKQYEFPVLPDVHVHVIMSPVDTIK